VRRGREKSRRFGTTKVADPEQFGRKAKEIKKNIQGLEFEKTGSRIGSVRLEETSVLTRSKTGAV